MDDTKKFMDVAIEEARKGLKEEGLPIGSVLVLDGKIVGRGHNQRYQKTVPSCTQKWTALKMQVL